MENRRGRWEIIYLCFYGKGLFNYSSSLYGHVWAMQISLKGTFHEMYDIINGKKNKLACSLCWFRRTFERMLS